MTDVLDIIEDWLTSLPTQTHTEQCLITDGKGNEIGRRAREYQTWDVEACLSEWKFLRERLEV